MNQNVNTFFNLYNNVFRLFIILLIALFCFSQSYNSLKLLEHLDYLFALTLYKSKLVS